MSTDIIPNNKNDRLKRGDVLQVIDNFNLQAKAHESINQYFNRVKLGLRRRIYELK